MLCSGNYPMRTDRYTQFIIRWNANALQHTEIEHQAKQILLKVFAFFIFLSIFIVVVVVT